MHNLCGGHEIPFWTCTEQPTRLSKARVPQDYRMCTIGPACCDSGHLLTSQKGCMHKLCAAPRLCYLALAQVFASKNQHGFHVALQLGVFSVYIASAPDTPDAGSASVLLPRTLKPPPKLVSIPASVLPCPTRNQTNLISLCHA